MQIGEDSSETVNKPKVLLRRDEQEWEEREHLRKRHEDDSAKKEAIASAKRVQKEAEEAEIEVKRIAWENEQQQLEAMPRWKRDAYLREKAREKEIEERKELESQYQETDEEVAKPKNRRMTKMNMSANPLLERRRAMLEEEERRADGRGEQARLLMVSHQQHSRAWTNSFYAARQACARMALLTCTNCFLMESGCSRLRTRAGRTRSSTTFGGN